MTTVITGAMMVLGITWIAYSVRKVIDGDRVAMLVYCVGLLLVALAWNIAN